MRILSYPLKGKAPAITKLENRTPSTPTDAPTLVNGANDFVGEREN